MLKLEDLEPILKPVHIPLERFIHGIDNQDVMFVPSPQCPTHWHMLGSQRCPDHEYCAITEACSACLGK